MIEIIEKGKIPEEEKYRKKCYKCKTIFSYQKADRKLMGLCPDDWHYAIECPLCKTHLVTSIFDRRVKE